MRIAHVVARRVEAPRSGYAMRTWTLSTALASIGELVIVDVGSAPADDAAAGTLALGRGRAARYEAVAASELAPWFAPRAFDVVVADETALAQFIPAAAGATRIVSCQNVESELQRAHADRRPSAERAAYARRARTFDLLERAVLPRFDQVWAVSRSDADLLGARVPGVAIRVVPNVVPVRDPGRRAPEPGLGLFFGSLWYEPNQDAVTELLAVSDAMDRRGVQHRFTVAGVGAPSWLADEIARRPAVASAGFVDDLAGLLARVAGAVFPVTYGGGSMVKLVTALAAGCPVVTTPEGARGVPGLVDGTNAVIRPLGTRFVDAVGDLLAEPHRFDAVGRAGARLVADRYSIGALDAIVAELLEAEPLPSATDGGTAPGSAGG